MRLVEVAKRLGMTGQELRHELTRVDFGVKPTDREVPESLAQGIIRFVSEKYGIEVKPSSDQGAKAESEYEKLKEQKPDTEAADMVASHDAQKDSAAGPKKKLHVLRKLTLDDVSEEAVKKQIAAQTGTTPRRGGKRSPTLARKSRDKESALAKQEQIKKKEGVVDLPDAISVKEFAEKTGVQVPKVIEILMRNGVMANINQYIDFDTAAIVASELGVSVKKEEAKVSAEGLLVGDLEKLLEEDDKSLLVQRPPVVTVMGHVDHGKTAILDAFRKTDMVSHEAGGITQGIGAYQIKHDGKQITFLDTPGHEAFTAMRARGAQITDIVILVVAADEGIKPTTVEAINHAKDAGVPIIVAINKIDKDSADANRVKGELAQYDLQPEEWGGGTPVVSCSAKTGQGIDDLLESILVLAELGGLKANPDRNAVATVIESHLDPYLGPVASVVVNAGVLRVSDIFVCGETYGHVKSMTNANNMRLQKIGPSEVARMSGLSAVPETGDILQVVASEAEARNLLKKIVDARELQKRRGVGDLISRLSEGKLSVLKVVLKSDSLGSLEAVENALLKMRADSGAVVKIIHSAVGSITESDVMMAAASDGVVLGFSVKISPHVERIAVDNGVQVRMYDVIYDLLDEVKSLLEGLVEPEEIETITGHLEVRGIFFRKKTEQIIGGRVTDGVFKRVPFRIFRSGEEVGTGRIISLRKVDKDIKEAKEGSECGMQVDSGIVIREGDVIEGFVKEFKKKKND